MSSENEHVSHRSEVGCAVDSAVAVGPIRPSQHWNTPPVQTHARRSPAKAGGIWGQRAIIYGDCAKRFGAGRAERGEANPSPNSSPTRPHEDHPMFTHAYLRPPQGPGPARGPPQWQGEPQPCRWWLYVRYKTLPGEPKKTHKNQRCRAQTLWSLRPLMGSTTRRGSR